MTLTYSSSFSLGRLRSMSLTIGPLGTGLSFMETIIFGLPTGKQCLWHAHSFHPLSGMHLGILPRKSILGIRPGNTSYICMACAQYSSITSFHKNIGLTFASWFQESACFNDTLSHTMN